MSLSETLRAWMLAPVLDDIKRMEKQMSDLSDLTQQLKDSVTKLGADLLAAFKRLEDKVAAGGVKPEDLDALREVVSAIAALDTASNSEAV